MCRARGPLYSDKGALFPFRATVCSFSVEITQNKSLIYIITKGPSSPRLFLCDSLLNECEANKNVLVAIKWIHSHKQAEGLSCQEAEWLVLEPDTENQNINSKNNDIRNKNGHSGLVSRWDDLDPAAAISAKKKNVLT